MAQQQRESIEVAFDATVVGVDADGGRRLIARLPEDASRALPSRGQVAVVGTVGVEGLPALEIETVIEPDGLRGHWIDVAALLGEHAGIDQRVRFELRPSADWPEPSVPEDFAVALAGAPSSTATWEDITPMARWEWVRWISSTKNEKTRDRRIEVGLSKLEDGKRRPCCFDLSSCTDPDLSKSGKLAI